MDRLVLSSAYSGESDDIKEARYSAVSMKKIILFTRSESRRLEDSTLSASSPA